MLHVELDNSLLLQGGEIRAHLADLKNSSESKKIPGRVSNAQLLSFFAGQDCPEDSNPGPISVGRPTRTFMAGRKWCREVYLVRKIET